MSLLGVLLVLFIVLKLIGAIDWTWFWVLSPLYPSILFVLGCIGVVAIGHRR